MRPSIELYGIGSPCAGIGDPWADFRDVEPEQQDEVAQYGEDELSFDAAWNATHQQAPRRLCDGSGGAFRAIGVWARRKVGHEQLGWEEA